MTRGDQLEQGVRERDVQGGVGVGRRCEEVDVSQ
jgi:hypothetical protein